MEEELLLGCSALRSLTLPDSIEKIGERAMYRCSSLETVHIPQALYSLGEGAFSGCRKLRSVSLPTTLKRMGSRAFEGCVSLYTVLLPDCNTWVGESIFADCEQMRVLVVADSRPIFRHRKDRWGVPKETHIILHSELTLALLFAELSDPETGLERKQELRGRIRKRVAKMKRRNHLHSVEPIRKNLALVMDAIGEQANPEIEDELLK